MATNKWLNALDVLKDTTNTLRENLRAGGIACDDKELLQDLVAKTPSLAPITNEIEDNNKWKPDPLWVFPDPNGSGQNKTIRQIYDEDTMPETYKYRGIYLIYGELDTIDLKAVLRNTATAYTFITSDGARYNDVVETSMIHTWDKTKDVIDSDGRPVRYIRIYSETASIAYIPSFDRQLIWAIHNLGSVLNSCTKASQYYTTTNDADSDCIKYHHYECLELESNFGNNYIYVYYAGFPKCLKCNFEISSHSYFPSFLVTYQSTSYQYILVGGGEYIIDYTPPRVKSTLTSATFSVGGGLSSLRSINVPDRCTSCSISLGSCPGLDNIDFSETTNLATITVSSPSVITSTSYNSGYYGASINARFHLNVPNTVTTLNVRGLNQDSINLPDNLTSLTMESCDITALAIPNKVSSLSLTCLPKLTTLTIPETWGRTSTTSSTSFYSMPKLRRVNIPQDFDRTLSFSTHSPHLEHDSIISMFENLKDNTGTTAKTLTLGSINLEKLSDEEKAIATNKNWTLA